ncbi:MAG: glycosyltransferase family 4 protein [bacterium]|nr:glycosyltransferase family 1 protein [Planctomycetota bacterium]
MKLLMVSGDRQVSIGERGPFYSMQAEFSRHFERIDVICPRPPGTPTVSCIHERVFFHPANSGRLAQVGYILRKGRELVETQGHSLIVSHDYGWFYNGLGSARLSAATGVPYLSELHHVPGHPRAADLRERFDKLVARAYVAWARSRTPAFRVVNRGEMPDLLTSWGVPQSQILVLPSLYIDFDLFHPSQPEAGEERFDQDVLFVGRMVNNKGLSAIVEALALLKGRGQGCRGLFVGKGELLGWLRAKVHAMGLADAVRFIEWVKSPSDLARIYRRSRVAVCASTCEGGPRVTVEAMACGTPVVSTPVGIMGELLEDGEAGRLCDFNAASLAEHLGVLLGDPSLRERAGARAVEIVQRFEYKAALEVYARGLIDLAAAAGGRS